MKQNNTEIHEFGSSPLRSQRDYGERTASDGAIFSGPVDNILLELSSFRYGCVYTDGSCITDMATIDENDGRDIWIQSPKEFWNRRIGMCHDASVLVDAVLKVECVEHKCYYIYSDNPPFYPTHSFIVALSMDGFKRIIDVFATKTCVYPEKFSNYENASKWRFENWLKTDNDGKGNAFLFVGERMPKPKCGFVEFSKNVIKTFKDV